MSLFCNITGMPDPEMRWYKNNKSITDNDSRISFIAGMRTLKIQKSAMEDSGDYECVGENRFGIAKQSINLTITRITPLTGIMSTHLKFRIIKNFYSLRHANANDEYCLGGWNSCADIGFNFLHRLFVCTITTRTTGAYGLYNPFVGTSINFFVICSIYVN